MAKTDEHRVVVMKRGGFKYGQHRNGRPRVLKFGDIISLEGLPNDRALLSQGFFEMYNPALHDAEGMTL